MNTLCGDRARPAALSHGLFTLDTAPDYASRLALAQRVPRLSDGAAPDTDPRAAMHGNFARVIEQNFACASPARVARWLDTVETRSLVTLAQAYVNATEMKGRRAIALDILAHRLDAPRLARLAAFFGHARVHAATRKVAPAKLEAFDAHADARRRGPVPGDMQLHGHGPDAAGDPGRGHLMFLDHGMEEVYLAFRTAPIGATSAAAALFQTGLVVGSATYFSWNAAHAIGGYLRQGMRVCTPSLWHAIVDAVQWWMEELTAPASLPADSVVSAQARVGRLQRDGFLHVYQLDAGLHDDFAIGAGDHQSAWAWARLHQQCGLVCAE